MGLNDVPRPPREMLDPSHEFNTVAYGQRDIRVSHFDESIITRFANKQEDRANMAFHRMFNRRV